MISFLTLVLRFLARVFLLFFLLTLRRFASLTPRPLRGGTETVVGARYIVAISIARAFLSRFGLNKTSFLHYLHVYIFHNFIIFIKLYKIKLFNKCIIR